MLQKDVQRGGMVTVLVREEDGVKFVRGGARFKQRLAKRLGAFARIDKNAVRVGAKQCGVPLRAGVK
jgi:hypothetical protein